MRICPGGLLANLCVGLLSGHAGGEPTEASSPGRLQVKLPHVGLCVLVQGHQFQLKTRYLLDGHLETVTDPLFFPQLGIGDGDRDRSLQHELCRSGDTAASTFETVDAEKSGCRSSATLLFAS